MAKHRARRKASSDDKRRRQNPACIRFCNMIEGSPLEKRTTANIAEAHRGRITGFTWPAKRFETKQSPIEQTRPSTTSMISSRPSTKSQSGARKTGSRSGTKGKTSSASQSETSEPPKRRTRTKKNVA